jgi:HPt (histidine-containing phosphotransfer) domain-containing protein
MVPLDDPVYDRSRAISQLAGDEALFSAIAAVFVAECDSYCASLEAALASGKPVELRREAHSVKSTLASFSCESGRVLAQRLENLASSGSFDGASEMTAEVVAVMRRLATALEAATN